MPRIKLRAGDDWNSGQENRQYEALDDEREIPYFTTFPNPTK